VQVIARLLKFRTQTCVWAESYSEPRDDIFAKRAVLSRKIAEAIIQSIPISLRPSHLETVPANIYETYLQGCSLRSRLSEEALANCIPVFESAVKESPQFAMAWAALANAHCIQTRLGTVPPSSALPRAKYYAYNALAIEDLAEARTALAYYQFLYEHAWDAAETSFLRALALDPKYPLALGGYAQLLAALGRHEEAVLLLHQACELDPFASYSALMFGWALYYARKYEPALVQLKKGLELAPSSWVGHTSAGMAYERLGLLEEALSEFRLAQVYSGDSALAKGHVAYGLARMGDKAGAREILCTLLALREERYFSPYWIALIHLALDQIDEALRWLECAVKERCTWIVFAREDPKFSRLHSDPRFQHLLSGVCPTWDVVIPA
jgi:tetratricopeptide (TPR) repeat protein